MGENFASTASAPRFALFELIIVILSGAVWMLQLEWGIWLILISALFLVVRMFADGNKLQFVDWLVIIFLFTAWVGYWAAYDHVVAGTKVWFIAIAVLLYFSLKRQPRQNFFQISFFLFCLGIGISFYFFLTHDFVAVPRKIELVNRVGNWIMSIRPQIAWESIHPNYVAGMIAITVPFIFHPLWDCQKRYQKIHPLFLLAVVIGLGFASLALVMATSRGAFFAVASGVGGWFLWRSVQWTGVRRQIKREAVFPILLLIYLCAVVTFLYVGPARSGSLFSGDNYYGNGSRVELFERSLYLLNDYPITGGGLGSFPGLFSQYILGIPYFFLLNSHNLFLDVGIEQGLMGGLSFMILYLASLWAVSSSIARDRKDTVIKFVVLFSLIVAFVHGMVDDYLYNGAGSMFSLFLVGWAMNVSGQNRVITWGRFYYWMVGAVAVILMLIALINLKQIQGIWYSNIGAVQLAKVELKDFPNAGWIGEDILPELGATERTLRSALQFDPSNRTANQRLGLIAMHHREFELARDYLGAAYTQSPIHRGIIKVLAYCYVWLGDMEKSQEFLSLIPEAEAELNIYVWWWSAQGRSDLSQKATSVLDSLKSEHLQP